MVCCTVIAALLGLLVRPLLALPTNPLAWRSVVGETTPAPPIRSVGRLQSFSHAFEGLRFLVGNEPNMRIHLGLAATAISAGIWLRIDLNEWRWLILAIALVLAAEALNTAVEQVCNAVSRSFNPAIKAAKDVAAGAVLIAAIAAALIGGSIFLPHLAKPFSGEALPTPFLCGGAN